MTTTYVFGSDHFAIEVSNGYFYVVNTDTNETIHMFHSRQECLDYLWEVAATYIKFGFTCREVVKG